MELVMKILITFLVLLFSVGAESSPSKKDDLLIRLPKDAKLKFKQEFVVTSIVSRSGTPKQSLIEVARIDLKGKTLEAARSRLKYKAAIEKLRTLKNFDLLTRVYCFVDFNAEFDEDVVIPKDTEVSFATPVDYGTPSEKYTKTGDRIRLDTEHDSEISGSFEEPIMRRLYCSFTAGPAFAWGTDFVNEMQISQLEALLASHFELLY